MKFLKAMMLGVLLLQRSIVLAAEGPRVYPGAEWTSTQATKLGWSAQRLNTAHQYATSLPPANVFVVDHGQVVVEWGDASQRIKISSMRKSLLSALYGIYTPGSSLDLDSTLEQLAIDDDPPLTAAEKQATVRMLLEARSGVYHGYVAGTPGMRDGWPERGSHVPGSYWYYNNWDFNALGTIFEQSFRTPIASAFDERIAKPTAMQDFRKEDMYYLQAAADASPDFDRSIHPAYHFRLSARDLARFGLLFLRHGVWSGKTIVPGSWVDDSTAQHSQAGLNEGYGYLWWVDGFGLPERSFSAQGALAKFVIVIPARDLVVVYLNHTEFPDDASSLTKETVKLLPSISHEQFGQLVKLLLAAQR